MGARQELSRLYERLGEHKKCEDSFKRMIEINPNHLETFIFLSDYYLRNSFKNNSFDKAIEIVGEGLGKNPGAARLYGHLAVLHFKKGDFELTKEYFKKANQLRESVFSPILKNSYEKLYNYIHKKDIIFIAMQYPMCSLEALKKIFDSTDGVVFIDNEDIFKDAVFKDGYDYYFMDNFGGDFGHCTPEGNRLLAENVANTILKEVFKIKRDGDFKSK
ncbi:MAG: hypothetical protein PHQ54_04920, partial [Candidatus Omnitrophica bacterium]|nr:hypothetical protein [Candidatus Omnitrophota bacterium]